MISPSCSTTYQVTGDAIRTKSNRISLDFVRFCSIGSIGSEIEL